MSLVALSALGLPLVVRFEGASADEVRHFVEAWAWCGAVEVSAAPPEAQLVRAQVRAAEVEREVDVTSPGTVAPDDRPDVSSSSFRGLEDHLSGLLTRRAIDAQRNDLVLLHAGAVADLRTGSVIAFVGPSGRGKTTASIALGSVFGYVTDETVGVDAGLGVLTYPKPLSVKQPAPERYKDQVGPADLGLVPPPPGSLRLVGVVMLDRRETAGAAGAAGGSGADSVVAPASIRSIGLAEAIGDLVPQLSYLALRKHPLQRLRDVLERCGGLKQVTYTEAATLVPVFEALFAEAARHTPERQTVLHAVFDDAVREGDSLVVLGGGVVRVLGGIAPTLLLAAVTGATLEELTAAVTAVHGEPADGSADALVRIAVDELAAVGLLAVAGGP